MENSILKKKKIVSKVKQNDRQNVTIEFVFIMMAGPGRNM
jgi:hypothetical protein